MSALLKAKAEVLEGARMSLKDRAVLSEISKSKAKGETPEMMAVRASKTAGSSTATDTLGVIAEVRYPSLGRGIELFEPVPGVALYS